MRRTPELEGDPQDVFSLFDVEPRVSLAGGSSSETVKPLEKFKERKVGICQRLLKKI